MATDRLYTAATLQELLASLSHPPGQSPKVIAPGNVLRLSRRWLPYLETSFGSVAQGYHTRKTSSESVAQRYHTWKHPPGQFSKVITTGNVLRLSRPRSKRVDQFTLTTVSHHRLICGDVPFVEVIPG